VVFDTPPTALTLRFLSMPAVSRLWVAELTKLRERILRDRQTIVRLNPQSPVAESCVDKEDDKVYGKLGNIRARLVALENLFSKQAFMSVIVNPDELSVSEALRIKDELFKLGIALSVVCINKQSMSDAAWVLSQEFDILPKFTSNFTRNGIHSREELTSLGIEPLVEYFLDDKLPAERVHT